MNHDPTDPIIPARYTRLSGPCDCPGRTVKLATSTDTGCYGLVFTDGSYLILRADTTGLPRRFPADPGFGIYPSDHALSLDEMCDLEMLTPAEYEAARVAREAAEAQRVEMQERLTLALLKAKYEPEGKTQ